MEDDKELFSEYVESRSVLSSCNNSIILAEQDVVEAFNMELTTKEEAIKVLKRGREEDETGWKLVQNKDSRKKFKESSIEIYISSKEKLPRQFALARLFKENGINDIMKVKYINSHRVRIDCKNEMSATKLVTCKDFIDKDWRFSRPDYKSYSYGVIKNVDLELTDDELKSCLSYPDSFELVSLKRLKRRNTSESPEELWVTSEAVRLCFKGDMLPAYVYADSLSIKVEPYVFPVSQCSRCWKFGHTARVCPSKKILCPKCGSNHPNCDIQHFKCINCGGSHMALSKICPAYLKEKKLKDLMAEFNCTYRKALLLYVAPSPCRIQPEPQPEPITVVNTADLFPQHVENVVFTERSSSPLYADMVKTKAVIHNLEISKDKKSVKKTEKTRSAKENEFESANWSPREATEANELNNEAQEPREKEVHFEELITRIKEIIFLKKGTMAKKFKMIIQCCVQWLILVVVDNVSDWKMMKRLLDFFNGSR
ncbi:hypothetical protein PYW07_013148 [Mythimna separata]|uniref:Nucleic-acid-binding protein from mobile element jockey n=1 Tax=Mythimna separata TaxID=271217 RepID=A0AAD8DK01_MYTSE|nr:hypothetical protein PYW07_013148 [Mythimna separata]